MYESIIYMAGLAVQETASRKGERGFYIIIDLQIPTCALDLSFLSFGTWTPHTHREAGVCLDHFLAVGDGRLARLSV